MLYGFLLGRGCIQLTGRSNCAHTNRTDGKWEVRKARLLRYTAGQSNLAKYGAMDWWKGKLNRP